MFLKMDKIKKTIVAECNNPYIDMLFWGGILFLYCLNIIFFKHSEKVEVALYIASFGVLPILAAGFYFFCLKLNNKFKGISELIRLWNGGLLVFVVAYIGFRPIVWVLSNKSLLLPDITSGALLGLVALHALGLLILFYFRSNITAQRTSIIGSNSSPIVFSCFVILLVASTFLNSPWEPSAANINDWISRFLKNPRVHFILFLSTVLFGILILLLRYERKCEDNRPSSGFGLFVKSVAIFFICCATLLLFDHGLVIDAHHFITVISPAQFLRNGGAPLIDVHSLYGFLPITLIAWAYDFLPNTAHTAGFVVRVMTIINFLAFVLLVYRISGNKLAALVFAFLVLLRHIDFASAPWNPNSNPSAFGLRYMWPTILCLLLAWLPRGKITNPAILLTIIISSFWSIEACLSVAIIYLAFAVTTGLLTSEYTKTLKSVGCVVAAVVLVHGVFAVWTLMEFGQLPRYDKYLAVVGALRGHWALPIPGNYLAWLIYVAVFLTALAGIAHLIFSKLIVHKSNTISDTEWWQVSCLLPSAVFGVLCMSYFIGRSTLDTLALGQLPLFAVIIGASIRVFLSGSLKPISRIAVFSSLIAAGICVNTVSLFNFTNPYSPTSSNSTVLRTCFSPQGCWPNDVLVELNKNLNRKKYLATDQTAKRHWPFIDQLQDALYLVNKHVPNKKRVALFLGHAKYAGDVSDVIFLYSGKWNKWPISRGVNDFNSRSVWEEIKNSAVRFHHGEKIFVLQDESLLYPYEKELLDLVKVNWSLCPIEISRHKVIVYELRDFCTKSSLLPLKKTEIVHKNFNNMKIIAHEGRYFSIPKITEFDYFKFKKKLYSKQFEGKFIGEVKQEISISMRSFYLKVNKKEVSSSHETGMHKIDRAFDNSTSKNSFWEVGGFPVAAKIKFDMPTRIVDINLQNGDSLGRMPKTWKLFGSKKQNKWKELAVVSDAKNWEPHERRNYRLQINESWPYYKLVFLDGFSSGGLRVYEIVLGQEELWLKK